MDASLTNLKACVKLSLSSNTIEKFANLNGLTNLRILCLARNNIKNLNGLDSIGQTLEQLWISYNNIEKMKGIHVLKELKVLVMSNNNVKVIREVYCFVNTVQDWGEFNKLADLKKLEELVFNGNPLEEKHKDEGNWIEMASEKVQRLLPLFFNSFFKYSFSLKKIDGIPIIRDDPEEE